MFPVTSIARRSRITPRAALAATAALAIGAGAAARWVGSQQEIRSTASAVVQGSVDDRARVLALLEHTWQLPAVTLRPLDEAGVASLDTAGRRLAHFYAALPFNLIPASDVLRYGFAFGGPCGAKSRLLVALLRSQGYSARLTGLSTADFVPLHTLVEVQLEGEWVPLDPTYNVYFEGPEGHLAATHEVASRPDVFERGGRRAHDYPIETYTYVNVSRLSVFYVIQRSLRAISLASNEGSPELYSRLNRVVPDSVLQYDLGLPYLYEEPELLAASGFAGISLLIAFLSRHRSRRAPAARSQARP